MNLQRSLLHQVYSLAQDLVSTKRYLSWDNRLNKLSPPRSCGAIFDPASQSHLNKSSMHHADQIRTHAGVYNSTT
jgi:hypothetical protein